MNALLEELKNTSVLLRTHWNETQSLWDDCVRDKVEKTYIDTFCNSIHLCLKGQYGSTYVFGQGMIEFFDLIEKTARILSQYSEEKTTFDATGKQALTIRYAEDERHKKPYPDEAEEDMMVDYDNYPKQP
jgi:hypothetical protein